MRTMAKRFLLPLSIALTGLLFPPNLLPTPFELRVVDEQTGVGVPVHVTADNGIGRNTPNGYIYWWAPSMMRRSMRFEIRDKSNQFDNIVATLRLTPGGKATLKLHRRP
jgi:hypothetical protein